VAIMKNTYPECAQRAEHITAVIRSEEESFAKTLDRGIDRFETDLEQMKKQNLTHMPAEMAFQLYDTYGFPLDLTELMAAERNLSVDVDGFDKLMDQQRDRARASQKSAAYQSDALAQSLPKTDDTDKYNTTTLTVTILGYIHNDQFITNKPTPPNTEVGLILDRTCAYAESGGQVGDCGAITANNQKFQFNNTINMNNTVVHFGSCHAAINLPTQAAIQVNSRKRNDTEKNHTATHLLQWALRTSLGSHVHQEGSLVNPDYLRFDFTQPKALSPEQIAKIEELVRQKIEDAAPVTDKVLPIDQGRKLGAMALFSEKYGDHVRVVAIDPKDPDDLASAFSREFCGGTHVKNTQQIGSFKIIKEESVATGVRRITALTARALNESLYQQSSLLTRIADQFKTTNDQILPRIQNLLNENKKLKQQLEKVAHTDLKTAVQQILADAPTLNNTKIIIAQVPSVSAESIRTQIDWLRKQAKSAAIVLATVTDQEKPLIFAALSKDLLDKGLSAVEIIKSIAPIVGGGGGGKPLLAQAGGKEPKKINDALQVAKIIIEKTLNQND
ncbi:MAG: hypothetical protein IID32_00905, partial [Planctomycetes bacterium]|nr:hypothetical protein [Planctomycetota bacterium]